MRTILLLILISTAAWGADENELALLTKAQTDFDRVEAGAQPGLPDTLACVQSQAALVPVARPAELSLVYYRKGYCELLGAAAAKSRPGYRDAARDFQKAVEAWPERVKGAPNAPMSSALRVLGAVAHLLADGNADPRVKLDLEAAYQPAVCVATDMPVAKCRAILDLGRLWLGWIAAREGRLADAAAWFEPFPNSGWHAWIAGRRAIEAQRFPEGIGLLQAAVGKFSQAPQTGLAERLGPPPDLDATRFQLGTAQFAVKNYAAAEASFDAVVKARPQNARAIFLRGRAREMLGQPAVADYDLASRTAFANDGAPGAAGQAHLYHGVALYRRKDFARAEQEFSSALNFEAGDAAPDASAWRHMAAVAGGACGASASLLDQSLDHVSDFFPRREAATLVAACADRARSISEVVAPPE